MDLHLGDDMYESFVEYQNRMMAQFDKMVEDYGFRVIDASRPIDAVFAVLKEETSDVLNKGHPASAEPIGGLKLVQNRHMTQDTLRAESLESSSRYIRGRPSEDRIVEPRGELTEPRITR
jgi:hypothetical protein